MLASKYFKVITFEKNLYLTIKLTSITVFVKCLIEILKSNYLLIHIFPHMLKL